MMFKALICLAACLTLCQATTKDLEARDGSIVLDGNNNNFWGSAAVLGALVVIIIILDFAIFGTFASRSDELNPVSAFFFHARNGLQNLRNKRRRQYSSPARPAQQYRVQRHYTNLYHIFFLT